MNFPAVLNPPVSKEVQVKIKSPGSSPMVMVVPVGIIMMISGVAISMWIAVIGITTIPGAARQA